MSGADDARNGQSGLDEAEVWLRRAATLVVASVAAYASYVHQRAFALQGGADGTSAALWPFSVDGLLLLATAGLLKPSGRQSRRSRVVVWLAFLFGIGVSLAANIAAAPSLAWKPVLVAGWPPVALLLSVELLAHRSVRGERAESVSAVVSSGRSRVASADDSRSGSRGTLPAGKPSDGPGPDAPRGNADTSAGASPPSALPSRAHRSAEGVMWAYFQEQLAAGRTPTGAELDRVAKTNNYGRAVLARWRRTGRIAAVSARVDGPGG